MTDVTMERPVKPDGNIVLTGFMGTGKSTVGRLLARRLGFGFVDTDHLIVDQYGPIPEIFATRGEAAFRAIERSVVRRLADTKHLVIATGGGLMLDRANADALQATGQVFTLVASPDELMRRLAPGGTVPEGRPMLAGPDPKATITKLLEEREPAYSRFTPVHSDGCRPGEVADNLVALIEEASDRG